ncbi:hypothetical protein [Nocardiopsis sp. LOL_012]|uniref:hypothetical protein n=1 Tax=Nocardiopsis sp. LOL_012 TaxID=3345409 RepID=UPI003A8C56AB
MEPTEQAAALAEQTLDTARERLASLESLPTAQHVEVFDSLHRELSAVLRSLEESTGGDPRPTLF